MEAVKHVQRTHTWYAENSGYIHKELNLESWD